MVIEGCSKEVAGHKDTALFYKERGFAYCSVQGKRVTQEDAMSVCWYEEESFSALTAEDIGQRLWTACKEINQRCLTVTGGYKLSVTVYDGRGQLITATLGDTVAFLVAYNDAGKPLMVKRLADSIHHPDQDQETDRIKWAGGHIEDDLLVVNVQGQRCKLALSRALGDVTHRPYGLCDEASIHVTAVDKIQAAKIQVITVCDGFTEPSSVAGESRQTHENWLRSALNKNPEAARTSEENLAKKLCDYALIKGSNDNISVLIQTISEAKKPFLLGIYDGHAGQCVASYLANNFISVFTKNCILTQEQYYLHEFSAKKNFLLYSRDNAWDTTFVGLIQQEKEAREDRLAFSGAQERFYELKRHCFKQQFSSHHFLKESYPHKVLFDFIKYQFDNYLNLRIDIIQLSGLIDCLLKKSEVKNKAIFNNWPDLEQSIRLLQQKEYSSLWVDLDNLSIICRSLFEENSSLRPR